MDHKPPKMFFFFKCLQIFVQEFWKCQKHHALKSLGTRKKSEKCGLPIYKLPKGGLPTSSSGRDTTVTVDCSSTFALSSSKKKSPVLNSTPPEVYQQNAPKNAPSQKERKYNRLPASPKFFRSETAKVSGSGYLRRFPSRNTAHHFRKKRSKKVLDLGL